MSDTDEKTDDALTVTLFGATLRPRNFLEPEDSATVGPVSFASSVPEKHAIGVGFIATVGVVVPVVLGIDPVALAVGAFGGAAAARRALKKAGKTGHVRDAIGELGYVAVGSALAVAAITALAVLALAFQRDPERIAAQFVDWIRFAFDISTNG